MCGVIRAGNRQIRFLPGRQINTYIGIDRCAGNIFGVIYRANFRVFFVAFWYAIVDHLNLIFKIWRLCPHRIVQKARDVLPGFAGYNSVIPEPGHASLFEQQKPASIKHPWLHLWRQTLTAVDNYKQNTITHIIVKVDLKSFQDVTLKIICHTYTLTTPSMRYLPWLGSQPKQNASRSLSLGYNNSSLHRSPASSNEKYASSISVSWIT